MKQIQTYHGASYNCPVKGDEEFEVVVVKTETGFTDNGRPRLPICHLVKDGRIISFRIFLKIPDEIPLDAVKAGDHYIARLEANSQPRPNFAFAELLRKVRENVPVSRNP